MFGLRTVGVIVALGLAASVATPLAAQCLLCEREATQSVSQADKPLSIEINSGLDFDRVALAAPAGGSVVIDPVNRSRTVTGALSDLGGFAMTGSATVRGEPGRTVRVDLPRTVSLRSPDGSSATISRLATDLPNSPRLDGDGVLRFSFGGRLDVEEGMSGDYRGRITITVDYQ